MGGVSCPNLILRRAHSARLEGCFETTAFGGLLSMRSFGSFLNTRRYSAAWLQITWWPLGFALRRSSVSSSRSRAALRTSCSLPARYGGGQCDSGGADQARRLT